jgi:hypothetical protein
MAQWLLFRHATSYAPGGIMKKALLATLALVFVGSLAAAADGENTEKSTTDTTKNPITGSVTTTKKYKKHVKNGKHNEGDVKVTEKTKVKKDGEVVKKVDASGSSDSQAK